jgi:hypothetical protein
MSPKHRPPLSPGDIPGTHFFGRLSGQESTVQPVGISKRKVPMTSSGLEPATSWQVAQCFNQMRLRILQSSNKSIIIFVIITLTRDFNDR